MFSKLNSPARVNCETDSPERPLPKSIPAEAKVTPGQYLKAVRERLQIGMREVQDASLVIASEEANNVKRTLYAFSIGSTRRLTN